MDPRAATPRLDPQPQPLSTRTRPMIPCTPRQRPRAWRWAVLRARVLPGAALGVGLLIALPRPVAAQGAAPNLNADASVCVAGKVYVDCNQNLLQDAGEPGIPGVRLVLLDGTRLTTDAEGRYSLCGLRPRSQVLKVDTTSLPAGARLAASGRRNAQDAHSIFVDPKAGELQRSDFIESSCSAPVLAEVAARRRGGSDPAPLATRSAVGPAGTTPAAANTTVSAQAAVRMPLSTEPPSPYPGQSAVARIAVEVQRNALPADGQSATTVVVRLFGPDGKLLARDLIVTLLASAGRVWLPGAQRDELGAAAPDADPAVPGVQARATQGELRFKLVAPETPQDVQLRVAAGRTQAISMVSFVPESRGFIAVGLVEGVLRLTRKEPRLVQAVRADEGFEAELRRFSRSFDDGKGQLAGRAALFLKGKIKGDALLTVAFDSEREARVRLLRDIRPDQYYPVYGDAATQGFEAPSSSRLYLRVDKDKSYALYGDFSTADGFAAQQGAAGVAPNTLKSLGAYNRTLTGVRGQWASDDGRATAGAFAAYDTLAPVTEEFRATGTSGPFVLHNNSALENSEKIEVLVRHKDNPGLVKSQRALQRVDDYGFEPFSGRILLHRPLASVDAQGDPVSLRVSYEVDQGGERFAVGGAEASLALTPQVRVGAALVQDTNPASPYKLGSAHVAAQLGEKTRVTAEVARSASTLYAAGDQLYSHPGSSINRATNGGSNANINASISANTNANTNGSPSGQATGAAAPEQRLDRQGGAARLALQHQGAGTTLEASVVHTERGFYNPAAPLNGGRSEASVKGTRQLSEQLQVFGEAQRGQDKTAGGQRDSAAVGLGFKLNPRLALQTGLRVVQESGAWNHAVPVITPNATPGSPTAPSGGVWGGVDTAAINPTTGQAGPRYAPVGKTRVGPGISVDATTAFVGAQYAATDLFSIEGLAESAIDGGQQHRWVLGGAYRVDERSRILARYEDQNGLSSAYGATRASAFSLGADTRYMPGGQLFSEYRLRDATSREAWWANGVRNTWALQTGITATSALEYLRVLDGANGDAAAIALGYDHNTSPLWKLSSKLEWRRVFDNRRVTGPGLGNSQSDSVLSTAALARRVSRDWTVLVRNHLLVNRYAQNLGPTLGTATGVSALAAGPGYTAVQDRFQVGAAYRPVANSRFDLLSKYEYKYSRHADAQVGLKQAVHLASLQANWHPAQPWWFSARLAAKLRDDANGSAGTASQHKAALLSGRAVYDLNDQIDIGLMVAVLGGRGGVDGPNSSAATNNPTHPTGRKQALGVEVGYLLQDNLWLSAGYNWRGFSDPDLTATEYTQSGVYLRLRLKFDEDLFAAASRSINRTLDRLGSGSKP